MTSSTSSTWVSSLGNTLGAASTNPFASTDVSAALTTASAPSQIGTKEDKQSMMAAFSDMGLALDAASTSAAAPSSAKALLAKKESERLQEQQAEADQRARRQARLAAQRTTSAPPSALMQAMDAFADEVSSSDTFSSALSRSRGTVATGSARRMRQKQEKAHARGGTSVRELKRRQRRDRHVY